MNSFSSIHKIIFTLPAIGFLSLIQISDFNFKMEFGFELGVGFPQSHVNRLNID